MRLSETITRTAEDAPPAPPGWRARDAVWPLLALGALAGLGWRHGPGVALIDPGQAVVIRNASGVEWLGDAVRVEAEGEFALYLPVAQVARTVSLSERAVMGGTVGRSREGLAVGLRGARVRYGVRPVDAPRAIAALGDDPDAWDRAVVAELGAALLEAYGGTGVSDLARPEAVDAAARAAEKLLGDRLAEQGLELLAFRAPAAHLDGEIEGRLGTLADLNARTLAHRDAAIDAQALAERQAHDEAVALQGELEKTLAALSAERDAAREHLAQARRDADGQAAARERQAKAEAAARAARAETDQLLVPGEASALEARIDALEAHGAVLLDHEIAQRMAP